MHSAFLYVSLIPLKLCRIPSDPIFDQNCVYRDHALRFFLWNVFLLSYAVQRHGSNCLRYLTIIPTETDEEEEGPRPGKDS